MSKVTKVALLAALAAIAVAGTIPAGAATSAYHMNGQGTIKLLNGGLPACLPGIQQGDCVNVDIPFTWGELTVQGLGVLQDKQVAGQYKCASVGTVSGLPFSSRIRGNTSNFELTFNFTCTPQSGATGPAAINGWFSNVGGSATVPYRSVGTHPHPSPVAPGVFSFKGFFAASNIHPYSINASNGAPMSCQGGFAPTVLSGFRITEAGFVGLCTAAAA